MAPRNVQIGQGLRARLVGATAMNTYGHTIPISGSGPGPGPDPDPEPDPKVTLTALIISASGPYDHATAPETVLANLSNRQGATLSVSPDDGRVVISADQTKLLRGGTPWDAGVVTINIVKTHTNATNSPLSTAWEFTVSEPEGDLITAPYITGIQTVGQTLTANNAVWNPTPESISTAWYFTMDQEKAGEPVGTASTRLIGAEHAGGYFYLSQIGAYTGYSTPEALSQLIGPIAPALSISGTPETTSIPGSTYSFVPTLSGGRDPYVVTNIGTPLPTGWTLNASTGQVSCDDVQDNVTNVQLRVTDSDGLQATMAAFSVTQSAGPKWYNFSFRSTEAGANTWNGGGINLGTDVDPNDEENVTSLLLAGADGYPLDTADAQQLYGRAKGGATAGSNWSATQSGNDVLLAGSLTASTRPAYTFTVEGPGPYDVRFAAGAGSTTAAEEFALLDGVYSELSALITGDLRPWTAATSVAANACYVSPTDRSIWKSANAGTTGSTAPSGAGPTFSDNGITWNRLAVDALEIFKGTTAATSHVIDQNNVSVQPSVWRAQPLRTFNVTGAFGMGFTLWTLNTSRPRQFGYRALAGALSDVSLIDGFGLPAESSPVFMANQPAGYRAYKISPAGGKNNVAAYSLGGDLAAYFTLQMFDGYVWLVANSTLLPDIQAGTRSLEITQTDGASSGSPHKTTFSCTVIGSGNRTTSTMTYLGKISTENWLKRAQIKNKLAATWEGHTNQTFTTDTVVTSGSGLVAAINALTPTGSSWHRIRLGAGTYEGNEYSAVTKVFGNGGLVIEPASGADPEFDFGFQNLQIDKIHFRNLTIPNNKLKTGLTFQIRMNDPGPTGIGGSGKFYHVAVTDCDIGINYGVGNNSALDWDSKHAHFLLMFHGASLYTKNNRFNGNQVPWVIAGVRLQRYLNHEYRKVSADIYAIGQSDTYTSTLDVFEDNDVWVEIDGDTVPEEMDHSGYSSGVHLDYVQIRTFASNMTNWYPFAKPNNLSLSNSSFPYWAVGDKALNMDAAVPAIYEVVSVSGSTPVTGDYPGPQGQGSTIVDGDVTWKWVADYVHNNAVHMIIENLTMNSASPVAGIAARQFFINSNGRHDSPCHLVANNNATGCYSSYGIGQTDGDVYAEYNTFAGPSDIKSTSVANPASIWINERGRLRAFHNVIQSASRGNNGAATPRNAYDEVLVNWAPSATSPNRPGDILQGTFSQKDGTGRWIYPSVPLDGSLSQAAFREAMRSQIRAKFTSGFTAGIDAAAA